MLPHSTMQQLCDGCGLWKNPPFVEVYPDYTKNGVSSLDGTPMGVCGNCAVGRCVPAFRPSVSKWNFGRVVAFSYPLFALFFDDAINPEWVELEPNPMDAYLQSLVAVDEDRDDDDHDHLKSPISLSSSRGFHTPPPPRQPPFAWHSQAPPVSTFDYSMRSPYETVPQPVQGAPYAATFENPRAPSIWNERKQAPYMDRESLSYSEPKIEATKLVQKSSPRLWTNEEDRVLILAVQKVFQSSGTSSTSSVKWPDVAKLVPGRTGKQCRERYFNHLAPSVVSAEWTPVEDATVCRMYRQLGTSWAFISRLLPGRSDNNVKNRFHYLRRQLEKMATSSLGVREADAALDHHVRDQIHQILVTDNAPKDDFTVLVCDILTRMVRTGQRLLAPMDLYRNHFGPFVAPRPSDTVLCTRCALLVPAAQTGSEVCSKTGWCVACSGTMVFLSDALLRLAHEIQSRGETISTEDATVEQTGV